MWRSIIVSLALLASFEGYSQSVIRGILYDSKENRYLPNATVQLFAVNDSFPLRSVLSKTTGGFELVGLQPGSYRFKITMVGFDPVDSLFSIGDTLNLGVISLSRTARVLEEVIVRATAPPVRQKADTLEYSANSFKVNPDANVEDLVKKMPGITVENGTVKAGGEDVKKVTIDGRDFFGDDATVALRNLPSEVVDKIQVFDRLSDQAQFTGFDDGNTTKSINIVTRANMRNGQFGRLYAGYGTNDRYSAGGNVTFVKGNRRISLVGMSNNINQQNFANEDLLGLTSNNTRGNRGGNRGGPGGRSGGNAGNFLVGQQGGITKTNSFGINFSNLIAPRWELTGSYFFNNSQNTSNEVTERQLFSTGDSTRYYNEVSRSETDNSNHRLNLRIENKIDSFNSILITPSLSYQKNNSINSLTGSNSIHQTTILSESVNQQDRSNEGYNLNLGVLYRHSFAKKGRTFSVGLNSGYNDRNSDNYLDALTTGQSQDDSLRQYTEQLNRGFQASANITYTEPLGKRSQLQFSYNPSKTYNLSDQQTYQYNETDLKYSNRDDSLSTRFTNDYNTQRGGITFRVGDRDNMFSAGISYQQSTLHTQYEYPARPEISRSFNNLLPNFNWSKKLSTASRIRVNYNSNVNAPGSNQLQEIINNSNPLFLSTGNASLGQSLTHRVVARYNYTLTNKGLSLFANLFLQKTDDYIANASFIASEDSVLSPSVTLYKGSQLTKPVNMNGYYNARSFFTLGIPVKALKSNVNLNAGYSFVRTPGMINYQQNYSRTNNYNVGAVISSNISEYVDFTLSYSANFNNVRNSLQPTLNNDYFTQQAGVQFNLLSKSGWVLQHDLSNQSYKGLTDGFNQSFWLWNLGAGKKFLKDKKGELRLSVFDLLKQNRSITRTVTETYLEDVQTQVLQRYFMLTFSYRLRNFGQPAREEKRQERRPALRN